MMVEPLAAGAVHVAVSCALPGASEGAAGLAGAPAAIVADADQGLSPRSFAARSWTSYTVPVVSPVRDAVRSVLVVAVGSVHVVADSVL